MKKVILLAIMTYTSSAFAQASPLTRYSCNTRISGMKPFVLETQENQWLAIMKGTVAKLIEQTPFSSRDANIYNRPSSTKRSFAVPAWNAGEEYAFILYPKNSMSRAFVLELTYDKKNGAPFNPAINSTHYICQKIDLK